MDRRWIVCNLRATPKLFIKVNFFSIPQFRYYQKYLYVIRLSAVGALNVVLVVT